MDDTVLLLVVGAICALAVPFAIRLWLSPSSLEAELRRQGKRTYRIVGDTVGRGRVKPTVFGRVSRR